MVCMVLLHALISHKVTYMKPIQNLKKTWRPNQFLVCPQGYAHSDPDLAPSFYALAPAELSTIWRTVIADQPRTNEITVSQDGMHLHHTQTSKLVGFVDDIYTEVALAKGPEGEDGATLYIYSASRIGISDRGVNQHRIMTWLKALDAHHSIPG